MLLDLWIKHSASLPFWATDKCNIWLVWRVQVACQREMQVLWFSCQWAITTWQGSLGQSVFYLRSFCIWRFWEWWVIWWATLQPLPRHSGSVRCLFPPSLKCLGKSVIGITVIHMYNTIAPYYDSLQMKTEWKQQIWTFPNPVPPSLSNFAACLNPVLSK